MPQWIGPSFSLEIKKKYYYIVGDPGPQTDVFRHSSSYWHEAQNICYFGISIALAIKGWPVDASLCSHLQYYEHGLIACPRRFQTFGKVGYSQINHSLPSGHIWVWRKSSLNFPRIACNQLSVNFWWCSGERFWLLRFRRMHWWN